MRERYINFAGLFVSQNYFSYFCLLTNKFIMKRLKAMNLLLNILICFYSKNIIMKQLKYNTYAKTVEKAINKRTYLFCTKKIMVTLTSLDVPLSSIYFQFYAKLFFSFYDDRPLANPHCFLSVRK